LPSVARFGLLDASGKGRDLDHRRMIEVSSTGVLGMLEKGDRQNHMLSGKFDLFP
jgi:hypothetical protein